MTRVRIPVSGDYLGESEVCYCVVSALWHLKPSKSYQVVFSSTRPSSMKYAYAFRGSTYRYESSVRAYLKYIHLIGAPPLADDSHYLMKDVRERLWARGETPQSGWVWCEELET